MHDIVIFVAKYFIVIPVIGLAIIFLRHKRPQQMRILVLSVISAVIAFILVKIATTLHQDPRPFIRDGIKPYFISSTDNGFPSDHTVLSALVAFVVLTYSKRIGTFLLLTALLIGSARVISGVHHGQDVVAGFVIAGISVYISNLIAKRIKFSRTTK